MSKRKLINQERGSITVYAIVTIFSFIFILSGVFFISSVVRKNQLRELLKIKEVYDSQLTQISEITDERTLINTYRYVQNGLVVFFDAINNTGVGHSNKTNVWKDVSGNNHDAIYKGTEATSWSNKSYEFNSPNSNYFETTDIISLGISSRTIELVYSIEEEGVENIAGFGTVTSGNLNDILYYNNGINLNIYGNSVNEGIFNSAFTIGRTYASTIIYSNSKCTTSYYTEPYAKAGISFSTLNTGKSTLRIGKGIDTAHNKNKKFKLQALRIYNRELTQEERKKNYKLDKERYELTKEEAIGPNGKKLVGTVERDSTKNQEAEDKNGNPITIPAGYEVLEHGRDGVEYNYDEGNHSPCVQDGIVIQDSQKNQFVWVPVDETAYAKMIDETNKRGKLYDFSTTGMTIKTYSTTEYREPDYITSYDNTASYFSNAGINATNATTFKTLLQSEFNEMADSVKKYKGFYIGRYETGRLTATKNSTPVVQRGNTEMNRVNWYYIYANSKNIAKNNDKVTTSMIWGCQWDMTLRWIVETNGNNWSLLTDSRSWGNYTDSTGSAAINGKVLAATGYNEAWKKNNIYDMAGNVREWTIEAYRTNSRVCRGGNFENSGYTKPASYRDTIYYPKDARDDGGSRAVLYLKVDE